MGYKGAGGRKTLQLMMCIGFICLRAATIARSFVDKNEILDFTSDEKFIDCLGIYLFLKGGCSAEFVKEANWEV